MARITNPKHLAMLERLPFGDSIHLGHTADDYEVWLDHDGYWLDAPWDAGYVSYEPTII